MSLLAELIPGQTKRKRSEVKQHDQRTLKFHDIFHAERPAVRFIGTNPIRPGAVSALRIG
jgi:hypothetical protein